MAFRKRSGEHDGSACNGTGPKCSRGQFHGPIDQLGVVTPATTPELVVKPNKVPPNIDYKQFSWPMTTEVLRDILASCSVGRMILHSAELATLEKSFQSQLTAIMIDYHMAHDAKITAMQLENYSRCITMLFPHENKVNQKKNPPIRKSFKPSSFLDNLPHSTRTDAPQPGWIAVLAVHQPED